MKYFKKWNTISIVMIPLTPRCILYLYCYVAKKNISRRTEVEFTTASIYTACVKWLNMTAGDRRWPRLNTVDVTDGGPTKVNVLTISAGGNLSRPNTGIRLPVVDQIQPVRILHAHVPELPIWHPGWYFFVSYLIISLPLGLTEL